MYVFVCNPMEKEKKGKEREEGSAARCEQRDKAKDIFRPIAVDQRRRQRRTLRYPSLSQI